MKKSTINDLVDALTKKKGTSAYDTQAEVVRIEGSTAWVHIPGGVDETPVRMTINAKPGDTVQVRVGGGRAWLTGNGTAPPTDDARAIVADTKADGAMAAANSAVQSASIAKDAADSAVASAAEAEQAAQDAQDSLKSVVQGATTVEKAVSVMQTALEAVVDYDPLTDTTQEYFWHDANGAHVLGDTSGYRNDIDSSGMRIVDVSTENSVAEFGATSSRIGDESGQHLLIDSDSVDIKNGSNTQISIGVGSTVDYAQVGFGEKSYIEGRAGNAPYISITAAAKNDATILAQKTFSAVNDVLYPSTNFSRLIESARCGSKIAQIITTADTSKSEVTITSDSTNVSGDLTAPNFYTSNGKIGQVYSDSRTARIQTAGINTMTNGARVPLPAGTYVISAAWAFPATGGSGAKSLQASIGTSSANWVSQRIVVPQDNWQSFNVSHIVTLTTATTVYVRGSSDKTYSTYESTSIIAVRIA